MKELMLKSSLPIIRREYNGQPVVTLKDIDMVHQRKEGSAWKNYNNNRKHFIEGVDYFHIKAADSKNLKFSDFESGNQNPKSCGFEIGKRGTLLFTQTGYLMIVKSFTDDLSWAIQRELVNGYFARQKQGLTFMGAPVITLADYCTATGEKPGTARDRLRRRINDFAFGEALLLEGTNLSLFLKTNPSFELHNRSLWILTMDGAKRLAALKGEKPKYLQIS